MNGIIQTYTSLTEDSLDHFKIHLSQNHLRSIVVVNGDITFRKTLLKNNIKREPVGHEGHYRRETSSLKIQILQSTSALKYGLQRTSSLKYQY